jgi:uncharacterized RDD family membrane protein YckC
MNGREGDDPRRERRSPAARLVGLGARGAGRVAEATGVDAVAEDAIEEAIVRALRSPAVERALVRVIERNAVQDAIQRALTSEEVAEAVVTALDSQLADRVWEEILASDKAQMLVERIAEAPEVRAAIAEQGAGLITDVGRRLTKITEALDDSAERIAHRVVGRSGEETETDQVGLVTRALAAGVDLALIALLLALGSRLLDAVVLGGDGFPTALGIVLSVLGGGAFFVAFWSLVGQTPGMRFLSIRLSVDGSREVGLPRALMRILAVPVAALPLGLGLLWILISTTRRGWHDHLAGTTVVYDTRTEVAPWTVTEREALDLARRRGDTLSRPASRR